MTVWLNTLRRWFGRPEVPPAISGEQSVLFVLRRASNMPLWKLSEATHIPEDDLRPVLARLAAKNKIHVSWAGPVVGQYKIYSRK